jgi:hypothetical protein
VAIFTQTLNPTPFGFFDADPGFIAEADNMVTFVKRKLGDDVLSVELTKKQIWACFEEAVLEYSNIVNIHHAESTLMNLMGFATGSALSGSFNIGPNGFEQLLPRETMDFPLRIADMFSVESFMGGTKNHQSASIDLVHGQQDYDIYTDLLDGSGVPVADQMASGSKGKLRVTEVFHFNPQAAYRFFDTTSAINYLANEFPFESFTPETVFYVLPVFEDILRAGQLDLSNRVRRSNYSYRIIGTKIRIYPTPTVESPGIKKLWLRVMLGGSDPFSSPFDDDTFYGTSNISNVPFGNLTFNNVNSIGRQWIRQYCLALCKELLGLIRSKFNTVPIPGGDLQLNGSDLVNQAQSEKERLVTQFKEQLDKLTQNAMLTRAADDAEALMRLLKLTPMPNGLAIYMG